MYKKKRRICVAWLLGMMLLLCACGNLETGKDQGEVAENDKIQIGMSFDSFVIERWQRDRDIFVSTAKELGAEVNVQNANGDLEQQKKQINYFIDKGMDVIVVICIDSKGLTEEVQRAKDAGIKIDVYKRQSILGGVCNRISARERGNMSRTTDRAGRNKGQWIVIGFMACLLYTSRCV